MEFSKRPSAASNKRGRSEVQHHDLPSNKRPSKSNPLELYQLALNGATSSLLSALDDDPLLLDRPQLGGILDGRTLLHCAASRGHAELVEKLGTRSVTGSPAPFGGPRAGQLQGPHRPRAAHPAPEGLLSGWAVANVAKVSKGVE